MSVRVEVGAGARVGLRVRVRLLSAVSSIWEMMVTIRVEVGFQL